MAVYNYTSANIREHRYKDNRALRRAASTAGSACFPSPVQGVHPRHPSPPTPVILTDFTIQPCLWADNTDSVLTLQPPAQPVSHIGRQTRLIPATSQLCVRPGAKANPSPAKLPAAPQLLTKQGIEQTGQEQRKHSHGIRSGVKISQWSTTSIMNRTDECQSHMEDKLIYKKPIQPLMQFLSVQIASKAKVRRVSSLQTEIKP